MTEILKINTEDNSAKIEDVKPYPLYDENSSLLKVSLPNFDFVNPEVDPKELSSRLKLTMKLYGGIGLSANQCGLPYRVFVIGHEDVSIVCFNPRVVSESSSKKRDKEGCLSFPGLFLSIERPDTIEVEYENENGVTKRQTISGLTARCFLHELDHMNGIRFVDRVGGASIMMARKKQTKFIKSIERKNKNETKVVF